jgi:hypothetical protein
MLEQFYVLMKKLQFSYADLTNIPVRYRTWFIDRLVREVTKNENTQNIGGVIVDDDTPISQVLGRKNN